METVLLKIRRQDDPEDLPYWELFEIPLSAGMTVAQALASIREAPVTAEGVTTTPVAHDDGCGQGLCGACAMRINGRARLACTTPVEAFEGPIVIEPLGKFPAVRDLLVDRGSMLEALGHAQSWIELDGLTPAGEIPAMTPETAERYGPFRDCILCGACSEACPQVNRRSLFAGAFLFSYALPLNHHPTGRHAAPERLGALGARGGVADCSGAENCERVCPRGIRLPAAAAMLQWSATLASLRRYFWG